VSAGKRHYEKNPRDYAERNAKIKQLYLLGYSIRAISLRFGMSPATVRGYLKQWILPPPSSGTGHRLNPRRD
jgi:transposase